MPTDAKLMPLDRLLDRLAAMRKKDQTIVFTNGCFDLLHAGHVRYLTAAKNLGDILVIGLNSDTSVRSIKGEKRPLVPQKLRAEVLSALACVDFIVYFEDPDPQRLIAAIVPDVLVKGADWAEDEIIGADTVRTGGGRVERIPIVPEISTTRIIEKILARYGK